MPRRLILIRHAKSSWNAPLDDHARVLNDRGRLAATEVGSWMRREGYLPDAIYSSDAARTRETTGRIVAALGTTPDVQFLGSLYHAEPAVLLAALRVAQGETVALIAHNPGIAFFAEQMLANPPDHDRFYDYPTCSTLVCDFPITNWADAVPQSAQVVDFIIPKDLAD